ncbi:Ca2+-binding RTX toxin-like protein [Methylobacterium sp. BE186]|uniref:CAP domain-containing protein n=1 Tax=Methylobacterium sp. BE186 TaxID=2817715 RepID=UPI00286790B7|nr:CAP domain-containing protein [Methylobacterium sp. BE186]MDR7040582.1 Ca2+-binding RTX toxin-like protein [Methylobacterium sp. BE186]
MATATPTGLESYFLSLVNQTRASAGKTALSFDGELLNAADSHSQWMDQTDTFSHTGVNGSSAGDRETSAGYGWTSWGENIAWVTDTLNEATVQQLHQNLVNSPGHYANIVGNFSEVGIGLQQGTLNGRSVVFVTQDFGAPNATERAEANDVGGSLVTPTPAPVPTPTPAPAPTPVSTAPTPDVWKTLVGTSAAETLKGGAGNDTINGNGGYDTLFGGAGKDTFVFDTVKEAHGQTVADFAHGTDKLDLHLIDANTRTSGDQGFTFIGDQGFHHKAGELREYDSGGHTYLVGDVNGDAYADFAIKASGLHSFTAGDFIL